MASTSPLTDLADLFLNDLGDLSPKLLDDLGELASAADRVFFLAKMISEKPIPRDIEAAKRHKLAVILTYMQNKFPGNPPDDVLYLIIANPPFASVIGILWQLVREDITVGFSTETLREFNRTILQPLGIPYDDYMLETLGKLRQARLLNHNNFAIYIQTIIDCYGNEAIPFNIRMRAMHTLIDIAEAITLPSQQKASDLFESFRLAKNARADMKQTATDKLAKNARADMKQTVTENDRAMKITLDRIEQLCTVASIFSKYETTSTDIPIKELRAACGKYIDNFPKNTRTDFDSITLGEAMISAGRSAKATI
jgi:hypothetical protein